jgi:Type II restriction endonuclease EcoO109I
MSILTTKNINKSINQLLSEFNKKRLDSLAKINLKELIKRKNPYLFQAKNIQTGEQFIKEIIDATISSSEETIFGNLIEIFAIEICSVVFGGKKAKEGEFPSVDLVFEDSENLYLIGIKSGPSWGNADSVKKMQDNFKKINIKSEKSIVFVNGCCYGRDNNPEKNGYLKLCGQRFWTLISNNENFYTEIIKPLETLAKQKDEEFKENYQIKINILTQEFLNSFSKKGKIDWLKITIENSSK